MTSLPPSPGDDSTAPEARDQIAAYLDGELSGAEQARFEQTLTTDHELAGLVEEQRRADRALDSWVTSPACEVRLSTQDILTNVYALSASEARDEGRGEGTPKHQRTPKHQGTSVVRVATWRRVVAAAAALALLAGASWLVWRPVFGPAGDEIAEAPPVAPVPAKSGTAETVLPEKQADPATGSPGTLPDEALLGQLDVLERLHGELGDQADESLETLLEKLAGAHRVEDDVFAVLLEEEMER